MQGIIYMSDEGFTIVYDWMVEKLGLTNSRLLIYAIIYGFSKNGEWFQGSISFLCGKTGLSRRCVIDTLNTLSNDGLIIKRDRPYKGIHYTDYMVGSAKSALVQNLHQGSANSAPGVVQNLHPKVYIDNKKKVYNARAKKNKFHNYPQRTNTDYDMIENYLTGKLSTPNDKGSEDDIKSN